MFIISDDDSSQQSNIQERQGEYERQQQDKQ
jgi:hypothetical protein